MDAESCICNMVDKGSAESHRYYLARRTALEMLKDRGYDITDSDILVTLPEFRSIYGEKPDLERLRISASLVSQPSKKVGKDNLHRMILILQNKMTAQARQATKEVFQFKVELFQITDLLVNITKHCLKPKHYVLTPLEKQKLLSKYSVEDKQLPRMLESDAIARYYGLEKGQVVKITYSGEITESYVTYRCIM
ncbi:hypothetical protein AAC387_Pa05g2582 [Persea americana]|eukprot:TRINITY_DN1710_c0_g1_i2.p1 TRINITY_DN1710_c0_g1~~TRINITY_DN1710_c0_g1_i2.p1  ORF type:complete len:194 (-),score=20.54 TRINITY_DN1710_c0_g1_i2:381-962(-)